MKLTKRQLQRIIQEELEAVLDEQRYHPSKGELAAEKEGLDYDELVRHADDPRSVYHQEALATLKAVDPQQYGAPGTPNPKDRLGPPHNFSATYERDFQTQVDDANRARDAAEAARIEALLKQGEY